MLCAICLRWRTQNTCTNKLVQQFVCHLQQQGDGYIRELSYLYINRQQQQQHVSVSQHIRILLKIRMTIVSKKKRIQLIDYIISVLQERRFPLQYSNLINLMKDDKINQVK